MLYYDELLDVLGLPTVTLVGHCFGGMVAAEIAATSPERVERLVLVAPMGLWRDEHPVPDLSGMPRDRVPSILFADPTSPVVAALPVPDPTDPDALLRASLTTASVLHFTWPLPDKGLRRRLYRVHAPTLVVWGSEDRSSTRRTARTSRRRSPAPGWRIVDGAGHFPQLERPRETAELVTAFLAS